MEVRLIKPEEAMDYLKVSAASFIWKFDEKVDTSVDMSVLGAFHQGKLIAGMELYDFKCNYCGNIINTLVLGGICSQPESRRIGGVRAMFDEIGKNAAKNNVVVGFLSPFSISYYEKFGYANLNRNFSISVPFASLQNVPRCNSVELYNGEQLEELCALHNKCAMQNNLMALREDAKHFCSKPLEEADYTYIYRNSDGEADGYVRFKVNRPDTLVVDELFTLNPQALKGIIGFLRNYDGIVKTLCVRRQYQGSAFSCFADRIDGVTYNYEGGYAGRIYDLKKLLECNEYPEKYGKFSIKSIDDLPQNNGIFDVEYENGKASVTRRESGDFDISLTPPAAARLLLCFEGHNAQTASYVDGVALNNTAEDFFRAFPHKPTLFVDSQCAG